MSDKKTSISHPMSSDRTNRLLEKAAEPSEQPKGQECDENREERQELNNIKSLIFLGRLTREVRIGGFNFILKTLTTSEQRDLVSYLMQCSSEERAMYIKIYTLAYAIDSVNAVPLDSMYDGDDDSLKVIEKRVHVIDNWQGALVSRLFNEYDSLVEESEGSVGVEAKK